MFSKMTPSIKWRKYPGNRRIAALLVHGGCFTEGDETWNAEQAQSISQYCNIDVFTIDFDKRSFESSLNDIQKFYNWLYAEYGGKVGIIGCSSGGFLVLYLLNMIRQPGFVTLICPVMNPEIRENLLLERERCERHLKIQAQQLRYFKARPYPVAEVNDYAIDIVASNDDENVSRELIISEASRFKNAKTYFIEGKHDISYKHCNFVNQLINFRSNAHPSTSNNDQIRRAL